jgi:uncharacterized small protein (DUF1192 family)
LREEDAVMALFDEELPKRKTELVIGEDLSRLSIEELQERIATLKGEIARVEEALDHKRASQGAAEAVFKR